MSDAHSRGMRSFLVLAATLAVIGLAAATAPDTFKVRFGTTVAHGSGNVEIEFIRAWAPIGVDHLHELLTAGGAGGQGSFFDGATFFRVVPGFVVQVVCVVIVIGIECRMSISKQTHLINPDLCGRVASVRPRRVAGRDAAVAVTAAD